MAFPQFRPQVDDLDTLNAQYHGLAHVWNMSRWNETHPRRMYHMPCKWHEGGAYAQREKRVAEYEGFFGLVPAQVLSDYDTYNWNYHKPRQGCHCVQCEDIFGKGKSRAVAAPCPPAAAGDDEQKTARSSAAVSEAAMREAMEAGGRVFTSSGAGRRGQVVWRAMAPGENAQLEELWAQGKWGQGKGAALQCYLASGIAGGRHTPNKPGAARRLAATAPRQPAQGAAARVAMGHGGAGAGTVVNQTPPASAAAAVPPLPPPAAGLRTPVKRDKQQVTWVVPQATPSKGTIVKIGAKVGPVEIRGQGWYQIQGDESTKVRGKSKLLVQQ